MGVAFLRGNRANLMGGGFGFGFGIGLGCVLSLLQSV